jgi:hypothetical protein
MSSRSLIDTVRPCGRFVVAGTGFEAAVQDADESVGELAQRGMVFGAAGFELVVGRCCTWRSRGTRGR